MDESPHSSESTSENATTPTTSGKARVWMFYVPERKHRSLCEAVKPGASAVKWVCDVEAPGELGRNDQIWLLHALKANPNTLRQQRCYKGFPFHDLSLPQPGI
jgi:hypothetical protein